MAVQLDLGTELLTASELVPGQSARIVRINWVAGIRNRLMEMGLTRGTLVELIRLAPMGDPIELEVRGYRLSVRKAEAAAIIVESA